MLRAALLAGVVLPAAGCGSHRSVYPVRGKIVDAEGHPLPGALVCFFPADNLNAAIKPAGYADDKGNFFLTTYENNDGAPAGDYVVTVAWRVGPRDPAKPRQPPPDRLHGRFSDVNQSPLKAAIVKGKNTPKIELPVKTDSVAE
jgi:hypothetical protein